MAEKRRRQVKQFDKEPCTKCPYQSIDSIEPLIFMDKYCSVPAIKSTYQFMDHLYRCHTDDLHFLFETKAQEFVGVSETTQKRMDFVRWLKKVEVGLNKYKKDHF